MKFKQLFIIAPTIFLMGSLVGCNSSNVNDWITKDNWYELTKNATSDDIGKTATVKVNGVDHLVRLIDIDHDRKTNGKKAHTTWEFVNIISDENGNSISYLWNDKNGTNESGKEINTDFLNSSIRYALTGQGNNSDNGTTILAGVKGGKDWNNKYKDKTVLSMLPENLVKKIKTVRKSVGTGTDYLETTFEDKLFLPSAIELGYNDEYADKGYGKTYAYYKSAEESVDISRNKKQVNGLIVNNNNILIPNDSGQTLSKPICNYAGFNGIINGKLGGKYWLRSPFIPDVAKYDNNYVWYCDADGELTSYVFGKTYEHAYGVALMFCI